jgi:hypothetical protein
MQKAEKVRFPWSKLYNVLQGGHTHFKKKCEVKVRINGLLMIRLILEKVELS